MTIHYPTYRILTPTLGELSWKVIPDDRLLAQQLAWISLIKSNFSEYLVHVRQGFTAISLVWTEPDQQRKFASSFLDYQVEPVCLSSQTWEVPVCYDHPFSPDLAHLAQSKRLSIEEVIELHTAQPYRIHFFGFLPGFMYLNGLPEILHFPRKSIPVSSVDAGSVAIGGTQTGIYPMKSPGGWHLIGKTPISLFEASETPPVWSRVGDLVQFVSVTFEEFQEISQNPELWQIG